MSLPAIGSKVVSVSKFSPDDLPDLLYFDDGTVVAVRKGAVAQKGEGDKVKMVRDPTERARFLEAGLSPSERMEWDDKKWQDYEGKK